MDVKTETLVELLVLVCDRFTWKMDAKMEVVVVAIVMMEVEVEVVVVLEVVKLPLLW